MVKSAGMVRFHAVVDLGEGVMRGTLDGLQFEATVVDAAELPYWYHIGTRRPDRSDACQVPFSLRQSPHLAPVVSPMDLGKADRVVHAVSWHHGARAHGHLGSA